jgi:hypothetical protein
MGGYLPHIVTSSFVDGDLLCNKTQNFMFTRSVADIIKCNEPRIHRKKKKS